MTQMANTGLGRPASWVLAIDFGTSSTAAAIGRDGGADLVSVDGGLPRILSNVFLRESSGRLLLGDAAENASVLAPWCFERAPKVKLGQEYMLLGSQRVRITDAVGALLGAVAADAVKMRGGQPPAVIRLTHPVRWGENKRAALIDAAAAAGLEQPDLMLEPVAAAAYYARERLAAGEHVAVYDLGGGTLDTAVLLRTDEGFEVVGEPQGRDGFGGEDFDHRLYRFLGEQIPHEHWVQLRSGHEDGGDTAWVKANRQFQRNVRRAKELLTHNDQVDVDVPAPANHSLTLTVEQLNELIGADIADSVGDLAQTISSAGLEPRDLHAIYLAGGSSQIPLVSRTIEDRLGIAPVHLNDSKAVICLGAALHSRASVRARAGSPSNELPAAGNGASQHTAVMGFDTAPTIATGDATVVPRRRIVLALALTVAIAAIVVLAVALSAGSARTGHQAQLRPPPPASHASAGPLTVTFRSPWKPATRPTGLASIVARPGAPGIDLTDGSATLVAGPLIRSAMIPGGAPPALTERLGRPTTTVDTKIAGHAARTYSWTVAGVQASLIPADPADLALICSSAPSSASLAPCTALISAVQIGRAGLLAPGPDHRLARSLRLALRPALRARAGIGTLSASPLSARAPQASHVATAERTVAATIARLRPLARYRLQVKALADALRADATAFSKLASDASSAHRSSFATEASALNRASERLQHAAGAFAVDDIRLARIPALRLAPPPPVQSIATVIPSSTSTAGAVSNPTATSSTPPTGTQSGGGSSKKKVNSAPGSTDTSGNGAHSYGISPS